MGVPSFFRWLLEKYPRVVQYVIEEDVQYDQQMKRILPDSSTPNPNGVEYDNLYLDMNGIIHPCCHPENMPQPETEEEMIQNIFDYILHLFSIVRPRKLLYMAIDGVAPRAKMNQQRSRRFRAAQERQEFEFLKNKLRLFYTLKYAGKQKDEQKLHLLEKVKTSWDSNVITPGTPFMDKLSQALRYWIPIQLHSNPGWKNIKVIFSDANVPGEGEHKIAAFVRRIRTQSGYDPNTKHVFYGLDADLFMLGLATHEVHMSILREEVLFGRNRPCERCGITGHFADNCMADVKTFQPVKSSDSSSSSISQDTSFLQLQSETRKNALKPFVFAHLSTLREYLNTELAISTPLSWGEWNFERIIDDFIFLCFFVGNDFLPHLPSLDIREGALDNLIEMYKQFLPSMGGYLTDGNGKVNLERVDIMFKRLGEIEDEVFRNRKETEKVMAEKNRINQAREAERKKAARERRNQQASEGLEISRLVQGEITLQEPTPKRRKLSEERSIGVDKNGEVIEPNQPLLMDTLEDNKETTKQESEPEHKLDDKFENEKKEFEEFFKEFQLDIDEHFLLMDFKHQLEKIHRTSQDSSKKKKKNDDDKSETNRGLLLTSPEDDVDLGTVGWKQRYYRSKFNVKYDEKPPLLEKLCQEYVKGLCWVMLYYYQGCASWDWFYPFHYAPFASDLVNCSRFDVSMDEGKPFSPFGQLMGVLPAISGKAALPEKFYKLMIEPTSPIIDFYPTDFRLDLNGKLYYWQAVILLPFVEQKRLLKAVTPLEEKLTDDEKRMNQVGDTLLYVNTTHNLRTEMLDLYAKKDETKTVAINSLNAEGMNGFIKISTDAVIPGKPIKSPFPTVLPNVEEGLQVINCVYYLPPYTKHVTKVLPGVKPPPKLLTQVDLEYIYVAPRFGKPRGKQQFNAPQKDSHFNFNRSWGWGGQGFVEGRFKATQRNAFGSYDNGLYNWNAMPRDHQPTRSEYEAMNMSWSNPRVNDIPRPLRPQTAEADTRIRDHAAEMNAKRQNDQERNNMGNMNLDPNVPKYVPFEPYPATGDPYEYHLPYPPYDPSSPAYVETRNVSYSQQQQYSVHRNNTSEGDFSFSSLGGSNTRSYNQYHGQRNTGYSSFYRQQGPNTFNSIPPSSSYAIPTPPTMYPPQFQNLNPSSQRYGNFTPQITPSSQPPQPSHYPRNNGSYRYPPQQPTPYGQNNQFGVNPPSQPYQHQQRQQQQQQRQQQQPPRNQNNSSRLRWG